MVRGALDLRPGDWRRKCSTWVRFKSNIMCVLLKYDGSRRNTFSGGGLESLLESRLEPLLECLRESILGSVLGGFLLECRLESTLERLLGSLAISLLKSGLRGRAMESGVLRSKWVALPPFRRPFDLVWFAKIGNRFLILVLPLGVEPGVWPMPVATRP